MGRLKCQCTCIAGGIVRQFMRPLSTLNKRNDGFARLRIDSWSGVDLYRIMVITANDQF